MEKSKAFSGRGKLIGSAVALVLLVTGCASSGSSTKPIPQPSETDALRRKLVAMEQRAIMGEVEAKRLKAEVKRLESELREVKEQVKTAVAATPSAPIRDGTGSVVLQPALDSVELEEPAPAVPESPSPGLGNPTILGGSAAEAAATYAGRSAQDIYDQGYSLFHQRRYDQAELAFSQVLEHHPNDGLADNALFWIGESRYARSDFQGALEAFTGTVERYPQGNKVGDAMLKAGKCLEALGQTQRAIDTYRELGTLFPDTAAALVAQERLEALR